MDRMTRFAKRIGGAHARAGVLASVVRENPLLAAVAGIGFSVSYQTIAHIATQHHMPGPAVLYPVGIDAGILAMIAEALHLIREKRSDFVPRLLAWLLAGFTIYVNVHGSPAGDWVGGGLHVVMPALWVAGLELVRHRRVAEARADGIPAKRWIAAPFTTGALWLRMQRDGITSYRLALEMEQARLYARDLIRATPEEYRPAWSSLLRKRIRSGRLTEAVRKVVAGSLASDYAPGWEADVTEWVTTALALPAHLAVNLENTRAACEAAFKVNAPATPEVTSAPPVQVTPESVSGQAPSQVSGQAPSQVSGQPEVNVPAMPQVRSRRKVAARPARISDADLKEEIKAEFDADPSVSVNAAAKRLGRSRDRVRPLLEQVRAGANVRPLERKKA